MLNEDTLNAKPDVPSIQPKNGWLTSQGQMTGLLVLVCLIFSFFGIQKTPEQIESYLGIANRIAEVAVPLITATLALFGYTVSRGKTYSNAIQATAEVQKAAMEPKIEAIAGTVLTGEPAQFADGFTKVIGGDSWKDPQRYENLVDVAAAFGVPGAAQAKLAKDKVDPSDLLGGILSILGKREKAKKFAETPTESSESGSIFD